MIIESRRLIFERISILTCVIAASVGPVLLIGAHFSMNLPIAGLMFAFVSAFIYRLLGLGERRIIISKISEARKALIGIFFGLIPLASIIAFNFSGNFRSILFIDWSIGLASIPILFGSIILLFMFFLIISRKLYAAIYEVGYYFSLPLVIVMLILPIIPNSEGKVLLINVAIIYFVIYTVLIKVSSRPKESLKR